VDCRPQYAAELVAIWEAEQQSRALLRECSAVLREYNANPLGYSGVRPGDFAQRLFDQEARVKALRAAFMVRHFAAKRWAGWWLSVFEQEARIISPRGRSSVVLWQGWRSSVAA
jgi:hypothetical protein